MNTNSASKKAISMVCLIAGIILLAASLIQDISGSGAGWRGPALIIGAIGILLGMYLFPTLKHHRSIVNFIFVFPLLFTFVVTVIIPLCLGVFYSFTDWNGIKMTGFIGFANYKAMFSEPSFLWSLIITILFVVLNMVLVNVVAFMLALLCTSKIKGLSFFRASYFLPNLIGGIVLGYIWQTLLNGLLSKWGQPLLSLSARNGFIGMLILLMWQQIGYMMIIYIAGLNNVSPDLVEAAQIDGATSRQILFKIKLPMIMPSVTICTFLTLTNGFKMFDQNLSLTGGDPGKQSQLLALNIYDTFYARSGPQWKGIGQAKAVVFFILVVAIALIQLKATSSKEVQQ